MAEKVEKSWAKYISEEEFILIVNEVAGKLCGRYKFDIHGRDDILQQSWVECIKAMNRYEPNKGEIAPYLYRHLCNRLKNFKRDQTKRMTPQKREVHNNIVSNCNELDRPNELDTILDKIPQDMRADAFRLIDGVKIPAGRLKRLQDAIKKLKLDTDINSPPHSLTRDEEE